MGEMAASPRGERGSGVGPLDLWSEGLDAVPHCPRGGPAPFYPICPPPWAGGIWGGSHTCMLAHTCLLAHTCSPCLRGPTSHPASVHAPLTWLWFPGPISVD